MADSPNWIKLILTDTKEEIDRNTIIAGDFNTPLRSPRKINRATEVLNYTINQSNLVDMYIYKTLY